MTNYTTAATSFWNSTKPALNITTAKLDLCQLPRSMTNNISFACLILFIPVTVFGNLLVIAVILSSRSLKKQTTFLFLASLAVADTLVGLISMPFHSRAQWKGGFLCLTPTLCWIYMMEEIFLSVTSVLHLFVIGIDRYISLRYVYQYNTMATKKRIMAIIASIWCLSALITSFVIFDWNDPSKITIVTYPKYKCIANNILFFTTLYISCFILPLFCMIYTYSFVYRTASYHIKEIAKMEIPSNDSDSQCKRSKEKKRKKRQFRTLRSIVIVFVVYCVCWYPTIFYNLSIFHATWFWKQYQKETWWKFLHFMLVNFLPPLNSTTNPFIYVLCNKQFRKVCKQLYFKATNQDNRAFAFVTTMVTEMNYTGMGLKAQEKERYPSLSPMDSPDNRRRRSVDFMI